MAMRAYYAVFMPEDGGEVSVWFPDVPGCQTWGKSMEHAFVMSMEALESHLEALADDSDPIPTPSGHAAAMEMVRQDVERAGTSMPGDVILQLVPVPDIQEKPTRVNVSFHKSTLSMIDKKAESAGMTRSGFLSRAAAAYRGDPSGR